MGPTRSLALTVTTTSGNYVTPASTLIAGSTSESLTWTINATAYSTVVGIPTLAVNFSNIQNLSGGTENDTFAFASGATIPGNLVGDGGSNTLDLSNYATAVSANLAAGTATGVGGTVSGIGTFKGNTAALNTLTGFNATTAWNVSGTNSGTVGADTFTNFQNLTGGTAGTNTFTFANSGTILGVLKGQTGSINTLSGTAGGTTSSSISSATLTSSSATGFSGSATGITGGFVGIDTLTGTGVTGGALTGESGTATWSIGTTDAYTDSVGNTLTFSAFGSLTGGTTGNDAFVFNNAATIPGNIVGGGGSNTLDLSKYTTAVSLSLALGTATATTAGNPSPIGGTFSEIATFNGNTAAVNTLTGFNATTAWSVSGTNSGTVGADAFTNFQNLIGGTSSGSPITNTFTFASGGSLFGKLTGQTGSSNTLSNTTGGTAIANVTLGGSAPAGFSGTTTAIAGGFAGINTITGTGTGTLTGKSASPLGRSARPTRIPTAPETP